MPMEGSPDLTESNLKRFNAMSKVKLRVITINRETNNNKHRVLQRDIVDRKWEHFLIFKRIIHLLKKMPPKGSLLSRCRS